MGGILNTIINAIPEPLKNQAVAAIALTLLGLPAPLSNLASQQAPIFRTQSACEPVILDPAYPESFYCPVGCSKSAGGCIQNIPTPTPTPIRCASLSDSYTQYRCLSSDYRENIGWDCNSSSDLCGQGEICCHRSTVPIPSPTPQCSQPGQVCVGREECTSPNTINSSQTCSLGVCCQIANNNPPPTQPPTQPTRPPSGGQPAQQQCTGELDFSCNGNEVTLWANWNLTEPPEGDGNCNVYITKEDGSLEFDGLSRQSCQSSTVALKALDRNSANGKEYKLTVSNGQGACLNRDVSTKRVICGGGGPIPPPPPPTATPWPGSPSLPPGRTAPTPVRASPTPNGRITTAPRSIACNTSDISFEVTPRNPSINQLLTFTVHGNALVYREDTYSGGGFNNCQASGSQWQCTPTQGGNVTWTHRWRVCEGSFDLASCSDLCTKDFTFAVAASASGPTPTPTRTPTGALSPTTTTSPTTTPAPSRTPTPTVNPNGLCNSFCNRFVDPTGRARNPNPLACAQAGLVFTPIKQGGNYSAPNACGSSCVRCPAGQTVSSDGCRCTGGSATTPTAWPNPSASPTTAAPTLAPGDSWIVELVNCMLEYTGRVNTLTCDHTGADGRPNGRVEQDDVIFVINRIRTQQ